MYFIHELYFLLLILLISILMIPSACNLVMQYGYMAPEQFQNRATIQSDLYGLGCTILFLLSGKPPSSFPQVFQYTTVQIRCCRKQHIELFTAVMNHLCTIFVGDTNSQKIFQLTPDGFLLNLYIGVETQKRLKIDFQDSVVMDQKLKAVLERLLEPAPEDRFQVHCFELPIKQVLLICICFYSFLS
jgi:serine/threonine protein kinase